ncbi:MAG TPA: 30S ribosomal protein S1 [Candidatus Aminicenantes bacterium]|nr:30S ribosomal protein S1 [Candidatus Aminicenantes bacterium]
MDKPKDIDQIPNGDEFGDLIKEYDLKTIEDNEPVEGIIVAVEADRVIIDIGHKTEGILDRKEIEDWEGNVSRKAGDTITVMPLRANRKEGYIVVSHKEIAKRQGWERVQNAYEQRTPIQGKVVREVPENKGFMVDMGAEMFLPMSQADIRRIKDPSRLLGKDFMFRVTRLNPKDHSGVVSRKVIQEEERREKVKDLFENLKPGQVVKGEVSTVTDYGAFVNIGGIDGLVHRDNISYGRVNHPKDKLKRGDEVEALVLNLDREKQKISLGMKQLHDDPWENIEEKYPVGTRLVARVTKIVDFGAFIELEDGVEGLLHISDLTWEGKPKTVEEYVAVGDQMWVQVIELHPEEKKIKLGLKQLEMRPEEKYIDQHHPGEIVKGVVKKILNSRVFVELEPTVEGVVKISDISYFRIDTPREFLREGEEISAVILDRELDQNCKVKLGLKQLTDDEWSEFFAKNPPGSLVDVKVKRVLERGVAVEISRNIEGFVRIGEVDENRITPEELQEMVKAGEQRQATVVTTHPDKKRVYLSFRAVAKQKEREEIEKYMSPSSDSITTIGDLLQNEIDKKSD